MRKAVLYVSLMAFALPAFCQNAHHFQSGLTISASSRYGREAIYTDPFLYKFYTQDLKKPIAGDSLQVGAAGRYEKWLTVTADSLNRFRAGGGFGFGGYTYLTYNSDKEETALLNVKGNSAVIVNGVLHAGDPYSLGYLNIPIQLKKGLNEFYVRGSNISADLIIPGKPVLLNTDDLTLPFIVNGSKNDNLMGAVVLINASPKTLKGLKIKTSITGQEMIADVPWVPSFSSRKIIFHFNGSGVTVKGEYDCTLQLLDRTTVVDEKKITINAVEPTDKYSSTFLSAIDGSLQYYAVTPQSPSSKKGSALFLSVHGAGVDAIGQARAYQSKDWGTLVAATNRRPRGFNWEDWGRLDALEVLDIAKEKFSPDPQKI